MSDAPQAKVKYGRASWTRTPTPRSREAERRTTDSGVVFGARKTDPNWGTEDAKPAPKKAPPADPDPTKADVSNENAPPPQQPERPEVEEKDPAPNTGMAQANPRREDANPYLGLKVKEVLELLEQKPETADQAFKAEYAEGTPRKTVAKALLELEEAAPEPRSHVVKVLSGTVNKAE